jgi:flagellar motor switch protein FliM
MGDAQAAGTVAVYDFRHPVRLSRQRRAHLDSLHERMTRPLADALAARLQTSGQARYAGVTEVQSDQLFTTAFDPVFLLTTPGAADQVMLRFTTPFAQACIDRLLGGLGEERPAEREPTEIEASLLSIVVARLRPVVQETLGIELAAGDAVFLGAAARHAIHIVAGVRAQFEVRTAEAAGTLEFFYSFEGVIDRLLARLEAAEEGEAAASPAKLEWKDVHPVRVPVRALLHPTSIQLRDLAGLRVGDVVHLDQPIEREIDILVGDHLAYRGHPGRVDEALGVQITRLA